MVRLLKLVKRFVESKFDIPTVKELAKEFNVNDRTIFRDLNALEDAGFRFACGAGGGRVISPESKEEIVTPLFRPDQAMALLWAARLVGGRGLFEIELHTATRTLGLMATHHGYGIEPALSRALLFNQCGVRNQDVRSTVLLELLTAIVEHRTCRFLLNNRCDASEPRSRRFSPYRILASSDGMYCIGIRSGTGRIVALPIDSIASVEVSAERFSMPSEAELDRRHQEAFGVEWGRPMDIAVRFQANVAHEITDRLWHHSQETIPLPDGGVELRMRRRRNRDRPLDTLLGTCGGGIATIEDPQTRRYSVEACRAGV